MRWSDSALGERQRSGKIGLNLDVDSAEAIWGIYDPHTRGHQTVGLRHWLAEVSHYGSSRDTSRESSENVNLALLSLKLA